MDQIRTFINRDSIRYAIQYDGSLEQAEKIVNSFTYSPYFDIVKDNEQWYLRQTHQNMVVKSGYWLVVNRIRGHFTSTSNEDIVAVVANTQFEGTYIPLSEIADISKIGIACTLKENSNA